MGKQLSLMLDREAPVPEPTTVPELSESDQLDKMELVRNAYARGFADGSADRIARTPAPAELESTRLKYVDRRKRR
jgi:hypothetical protein